MSNDWTTMRAQLPQDVQCRLDQVRIERLKRQAGNVESPVEQQGETGAKR